MHTIQGIVSNGQIVLDNPAEFSDGTRVEVLPIEAGDATLGMREKDWPTTRDGIAALLARMDAAGPSWLSLEDDAAWRAALLEQKMNEKTRFAEAAEKSQRMWQ
jgi:hypothetical protein